MSRHQGLRPGAKSRVAEGEPVQGRQRPCAAHATLNVGRVSPSGVVINGSEFSASETAAWCLVPVRLWTNFLNDLSLF